MFTSLGLELLLVEEGLVENVRVHVQPVSILVVVLLEQLF